MPVAADALGASSPRRLRARLGLTAECIYSRRRLHPALHLFRTLGLFFVLIVKLLLLLLGTRSVKASERSADGPLTQRDANFRPILSFLTTRAAVNGAPRPHPLLPPVLGQQHSNPQKDEHTPRPSAPPPLAAARHPSLRPEPISRASQPSLSICYPRARRSLSCSPSRPSPASPYTIQPVTPLASVLNPLPRPRKSPRYEALAPTEL